MPKTSESSAPSGAGHRHQLFRQSRSKNLKKRSRKRNAPVRASTKTPSACSPPPAGNLPYRLPKQPPVIYISAVSRPNNVLEVHASGHKPATLTLPFCNVNAVEVPEALSKLHHFFS